MIIAIVGIETLDVQSEDIIKWIKNTISDVIKRAKEKGCTGIITTDLIGVDKEVIRVARQSRLQVYVVSPTLNTKLNVADVQFCADYSFVPDFADYAVIITNGQPYGMLDMVMDRSRKCMIINYLERSETWLNQKQSK